MNGKYGIMKKQGLITLEGQKMNSHRKDVLQIPVQIIKFICLIKLLKI